MLLRIISLQVLEAHGVDANKCHGIAVEIEKKYIDEISKVFVERQKGERTITLDNCRPVGDVEA